VDHGTEEMHVGVTHRFAELIDDTAGDGGPHDVTEQQIAGGLFGTYDEGGHMPGVGGGAAGCEVLPGLTADLRLDVVAARGEVEGEDAVGGFDDLFLHLEFG